MFKRVYVPLNVAWPYLACADVLSYTIAPFGENPLAWIPSKMIAIGGRNPDVHTAFLDNKQGQPDQPWVALGMRLARQKVKFLEDEVRANPGRIDVYRVADIKNPLTLPEPLLSDFTRRVICDEMRDFAIRDRYGTWNVLRSSLYFLPFTRLFTYDLTEDDRDDARPFCSQAVHHLCRKHGRTLLERRPDRLVLPGDLVTSPLLRYLFTLERSNNFGGGEIWPYYERAGIRPMLAT